MELSFLQLEIPLRFLANKGWKKACKDDPALALGLNIVEGKIVYKAIADVFGLKYEPVSL